MMNQTSSKSLRGSGYADEALGAGHEAVGLTERALGTTKQLASQAMERAGEKVRGLGSGVKDFTSKGVSSVSDATTAAQRQLGQYAQATGRYVTEQPVKSALIAAAVGAAVAALVLAMRRNKRYYY
jgi:ElaB/YqjD/DUF883 family membrane-anchored ribosome-binding protein